NGTVIVGTVIDPEMSEELRDTVFATGIGAERKTDISQVNNTSSSGLRTAAAKRRATNYGGGDRGATALKIEDEAEEYAEETEVQRTPAAAPKPKAKTGQDMDYLDIPAFLRRQVD